MTEKEIRIKKAGDMFLAGYNCAQSTAVPFYDVVDIDEKTLIRASYAFGGGVARTRNVCGVVSGIALIFGLNEPEIDYSDKDAKASLYEAAKELIDKFTDSNNTMLCSELLDDFEKNPPADIPYKEKPCLKLVEDGAAILCDYLGIK